MQALQAYASSSDESESEDEVMEEVVPVKKVSKRPSEAEAQQDTRKRVKHDKQEADDDSNAEASDSSSDSSDSDDDWAASEPPAVGQAAKVALFGAQIGPARPKPAQRDGQGEESNVQPAGRPKKRKRRRQVKGKGKKMAKTSALGALPSAADLLAGVGGAPTSSLSIRSGAGSSNASLEAIRASLSTYSSSKADSAGGDADEDDEDEDTVEQQAAQEVAAAVLTTVPRDVLRFAPIRRQGGNVVTEDTSLWTPQSVLARQGRARASASRPPAATTTQPPPSSSSSS